MTRSASLAEERRPTRLYRAFWNYSRAGRPNVAVFMTMLVVTQPLRPAIPYLSGAAVEWMAAKGD